MVLTQALDHISTPLRYVWEFIIVWTLVIGTCCQLPQLWTGSIKLSCSTDTHQWQSVSKFPSLLLVKNVGFQWTQLSQDPVSQSTWLAWRRDWDWEFANILCCHFGKKHLAWICIVRQLVCPCTASMTKAATTGNETDETGWPICTYEMTDSGVASNRKTSTAEKPLASENCEPQI